MNDQTLLALAGGGLLLWWMASGSSAAGKIVDRIEQLDEIKEKFYQKGDSFLGYMMNQFLEITDPVCQMTPAELTGMKKKELMLIIREDLAGENRAIAILKKISSANKTFDQNKKAEGFVKDNDLLLTDPLRNAAKDFLKIGIQVVERTTNIIVDIFQQLPGESRDSANVLAFEARRDLKALKNE